MDASPGLLQEEMAEIEKDLELMKNDWAAASESFVRTTAAVEKLKAPKRLTLKRDPPATLGAKPTREDLDAWLLDWLWREHETAMVDQLDAEALCAAYKTRYDVSRTGLSSKQSRLKADVNVNFVHGR